MRMQTGNATKSASTSATTRLADACRVARGSRRSFVVATTRETFMGESPCKGFRSFYGRHEPRHTLTGPTGHQLGRRDGSTHPDPAAPELRAWRCLQRDAGVAQGRCR